MFAHNAMDGKVQMLSPEKLLSAEQRQSPTELLSLQEIES